METIRSNWKRRGSLGAGFILALSGLLPAQTLLPLFKSIEPSGLAKSAPLEYAQRANHVTFDPRAFMTSPNATTEEGVAKVLDLNIFNDARFRAERTRLTWLSEGRFNWVGRIGDDPVILAVRGASMTGIIEAGGKTFQIDGVEGGIHRITELDMAAYEADEGSHPEMLDPTTFEPNPAEAAAPAGVEPEIDVMVLYDPTVESKVANMETFLASLFEQANEAYRRSVIPQKIRLVHHQVITPIGTGHAVLDWLRGNAEVSKLRDRYGADLVNILVESGVTGTAYLNSWPSVVQRGAALGNKTFAHELGHCMGARHNKEEDASSSYAHGYINRTKNWRTIMSYATDCSCPRIDNFSNPDISYNGDPTGIADAADNARMMRSRSLTTSNFMAAIVASGNNLVVTKKGMGLVTSDVAGIDCGADCSQDFPAGSASKVTLIAKPETGWTFKGWTGDCQGTAPCILTMSEARQVVAVFENPDFLRITLLDAVKKTGLLALGDSTRIDLASLPPAFTLAASTTVQVGSVRFSVTGVQTLEHVETSAPYTLFSETATQYNPWAPKPVAGIYRITVTAYSGTTGSGDPIGSKSLVLDMKSEATGLAKDQATRIAPSVVRLSGQALEMYVFIPERLSVFVQSLDGKNTMIKEGWFPAGSHTLRLGKQHTGSGIRFLHITGKDSRLVRKLVGVEP